jgi:ketosteroid isomerase-like protein
MVLWELCIVKLNTKIRSMKSQALTTVEKMFAAFGSGDLEKFGETVSEDTLWIYHGTQEIPKATFEGKDRATIFLNNILTQTEVLSFEPQQFICEGNMIVVLGQEHQRVKASGKELRQKWVQVYTVENGLITRMEEFASSEVVSQ